MIVFGSLMNLLVSLGLLKLPFFVGKVFLFDWKLVLVKEE